MTNVKQLKKGLRFNTAMRLALAEAIVLAQTGENLTALREKESKLAQEILDVYWDNFELGILPTKAVNLMKVTDGSLPTTETIDAFFINGMKIEQKIELALPTALPIPFKVWQNQHIAFDTVLGEALREEAQTFLSEREKSMAKSQGAIDKVRAHLEKFTSPLKLLEVSPDFEDYFPESYFEEVENETVSVLDILGLAA